MTLGEGCLASHQPSDASTPNTDTQLYISLQTRIFCSWWTEAQRLSPSSLPVSIFCPTFLWRFNYNHHFYSRQHWFYSPLSPKMKGPFGAKVNTKQTLRTAVRFCTEHLRWSSTSFRNPLRCCSITFQDLLWRVQAQVFNTVYATFAAHCYGALYKLLSVCI